MAAAKSSLQRQRAQAESTECYKDLSVDDEAEQIPKELLLDLSFLTDQERLTLIRVIKADQDFRETALDAMKKSIEQGRQFQELQKSAPEDKHEKCTCCGLVLKTICSRSCATKCSSCHHMVCKNCRKGDANNSTCILCVKEKLMDLQAVDYLPVLNKATERKREFIDGSKSMPIFYGSELLKKSLATTQESPTATTVQKTVTLQEKPRTLEPPSLPDSLSVPVSKQNRARSLPPTDLQTSTDVNDASSGFTLIRQGKSEESLDDLGSLYSEPDYFSENRVGGKIKLGIWYRTDERTLYIRVAKAKDLANINGEIPDPYVRMHLLPDKTKLTKRRTGIQRKTISPEFNETLKYGKLEVSDLSSKTLWVTVWHWDRHGRNKFLGEVRLLLSTLDLTDSSDIWHSIQEYTDDSDIDDIDFEGSKGRLQLALKYSFRESSKATSMQRNVSTTMVNVHIKVKKAEGIPAMDPSGSTNAFVRAFLLPNKQMSAKKKTKVVFNSLNPVWEEEMVYNLVPLDELETSRVLELTVWDHDRRGINGFIGGLRIGSDPVVIGNPELWMDSSPDESSHWEEMLTQPGEWVEQWHTLRTTMDPRQEIKKRRKTSVSEVSVNISLPKLSSSSEPQDDLDEGTKTSAGAASSHAEPEEGKNKQPKVVPPPSISITRGARGNYKITGEVLVGIEYKDGQLQVRINRAIRLAAVGKSGSSNPYIKVYLLPDSSKKSKLKTSIKKKTLDPVFNETLQYKVSKEEVTSRAMWLTVWSAGRLGNQFLGEACIPLGSLDISDPGQQWYQLHDFVETGVVLPARLTSPLPGRRIASPSHRSRANAFSRSATPASRRGSTKSLTLGSQDDDSQPPVTSATTETEKKSMLHQVSTDSEPADHQHLVVTQGEKRGSADSIIPVITVAEESSDVSKGK